jgi:hypothetical protein
MLAAHSNDGQTSVAISVGSELPVRIERSPEEQLQFPSSEATFFLGYDDEGNPEIQFCGGRAFEAALREGSCSLGELASRFCAMKTIRGEAPCFTYVGPCGEVFDERCPSGPGELGLGGDFDGEVQTPHGGGCDVEYEYTSDGVCAQRLPDGTLTRCDNDRRPGVVAETRHTFSVFLRGHGGHKCMAAIEE